jgi:hypothetical protein
MNANFGILNVDMDDLILRLKTVALWLIAFIALISYSALWCATVKALDLPNFPEIDLTQIANMRIVFYGVPSDYIDESAFVSRIIRNTSQFAHPSNMTWNLNVSIVFHEFSVDVMNSLVSNAYHFEGTTYYNITLLDESLSQFERLVVPKQGYLIIFMWVPDGGVHHSWFYIQKRPDLFLGRTDFFDGKPSKYWAFLSYFGGIHRALYFDLSDVIEKNPVKTTVTNTAIRLFNNALSDVFVDLLGVTDSRMVAADMQRYENYEVKILWLNGTGDQLQLERIEKAFEDLMPWTNWTITVQTRPMDKDLNKLIESRTVELSKPLNYSFLLANGSRFSIIATRNVLWDVLKDSDEYDPINQYLFEHVKDYFNLRDLENKSIIPVIFLQLRNDTAIGGVAGIGPGVSWFPYNIIIMGYQSDTVTAMGESGPALLTHQLRHEIGHWVSLSHHSARFELGYPKVICSMRSVTDQFCAFCKDARARMSFISYYRAISELFSNSNDVLNRYGNQESLNSIISKLNNSLQLFYHWDYVESVRNVIQVYRQLESAVNEAQHQSFVYTYVIPIAITLVAIVLASTVILIRIGMRRKMKQSMKNTQRSAGE